MGGSSSPPPSTTSQTSTITKPPEYAIPYAKQFLQAGANQFYQPYVAYGGQRVAPQNYYQQYGLTGTYQTPQWNQALMGAGRTSLADTAGGEYLRGAVNPLLAATKQEWANLSSNPLYASLTSQARPGTSQVLQAAQSAYQGLGSDLAFQELQKQARGEYLTPDTNPYLAATYEKAARDMSEQYQQTIAPQLAAEAARAGAFGSSGFDEAEWRNRYGLSQSLGDLGTSLYGGAYEAERGRQMQASSLMDQIQQGRLGLWGQLYESQKGREQSAAQAAEAMRQSVLGMYGSVYDVERQRQLAASQYAPQYAAGEQALYSPIYQMGQMQQDYAQQMLDLGYANWLEQQQYPLSQLDIFGSVLAQSMGRGGSSTMTSNQPYFTPRYSPFTGALGGALAGYGATDSGWGAGAGAILGGLGGAF